MVYARAYLQGKDRVFRTNETNLHAAGEAATSWYLDLRHRIGQQQRLDPPLFSEIAEQFIRDAERRKRVSEGQREQYRIKWNLLKPRFVGVTIAAVDAAFLEELREKRSKVLTVRGTPVKPATLKKDLNFVSLVLRHAKARKFLRELPAFPTFRDRAYQIVPSPRPFLDGNQYKTLHQLAKQRADEPDLNPRTKRQRQELYWFILICVGAALRVGEAYSLRWCDCELVKTTLPDGSQEEAVKMLVLGKHSKGGQREHAFGLYGAVYAFKAMRVARPDAKPEELLFLENHREGMKELLTDAKLRIDPKTKRTRDAKSLRPTGISMRLDRGDNVSLRNVARWARTSVAMVEKFYDQTHPEQIVGQVAGFRRREPKKETPRRGTRATTKSKR
jgi:integrase